MFSGVYWTEDKIVVDTEISDSQSNSNPDKNASDDALIVENQRLKEELERLKKS
jgi:hypothetical protein